MISIGVVGETSSWSNELSLAGDGQRSDDQRGQHREYSRETGHDEPLVDQVGVEPVTHRDRPVTR
jgi:hypothetical protein